MRERERERAHKGVGKAHDENVELKKLGCAFKALKTLYSALKCKKG